MTLTAAHLKRVIERYHDGLVRYRDALNRLNVYPVPDGDTGTNMVLTMTSVVDACSDAETMDEVAHALSHGSLMGARGNSGIILSQILRGLADTFRESEAIGTDDLVVALSRASDAAYESVVRPVEGTILTVVREAATGARETGPRPQSDLGGLFEQVYARARQALERTPDLLPVLKQAGVVDAGGAGLLLLLGAFLEEITGAETSLPAAIVEAAAARDVVPEEERPDVAGLRYEVMFFLEAPDTAIPGFRDVWAALGDSIVVVGGDGTFNCHIHTDDIGGSIEAGIAVGRPFDIRVTDLLEQAADAAAHGYAPHPAFADAPLAVVAVAAGPGVVEMFRDLGAQAVVGGGQSMNPSTEDLLAAVEQVAAPDVVVMPNNKNIVPVADQLDALTAKTVHVVPTVSVMQGIAAMVAYRPDGEPGGTTASMVEAAGDIVSGEITQAVRDATTEAGPVRAGDWLVLVEGRIVAVCASEAVALAALLDAAIGPDAELVTVVTGAGHDPAVVSAAVAAVTGAQPEIVVEVVSGGQPLYPYLMSVE